MPRCNEPAHFFYFHSLQALGQNTHTCIFIRRPAAFFLVWHLLERPSGQAGENESPPLVCCECGLDGTWPARLQNSLLELPVDYPNMERQRESMAKQSSPWKALLIGVRRQVRHLQSPVHSDQAVGPYPPPGQHLLGTYSPTLSARARHTLSQADR